ncbi:MAG: hypothetical protein LBJ36_04885 [Synergistaceae bacterium]|nr:hypothetical protein [Synergistaceae bacterium]
MRVAVGWILFSWLLTASVADSASSETAPSMVKPLATTNAPVVSIELPASLASSWERLSSTLTDALNLQDKQETLPESSYFGADKISNTKKINALLDKVVEILVQGDASDLRRQAIALRETGLPALRREVDDLRNKRISAPETSKVPWVKTRSQIEARIAELDVEIKEKERLAMDIDSKIAEALRNMGLDLDDKQIDILLTSVTGDDLFQNTVVFANVKHVVEKLAELSREDRDNLEISRRYIGMYLVLNDVLIATQEGLIEKINMDYKPRLAELKAEAEKLRAEALGRAKQGQYSKTQKEAFEVNAKANAMTARVAELYAELLEGQRKNFKVTLMDLQRNRDVAESTYKTVRSTGDLRNLIRAGLDLFDSIHPLSMPQLQSFENEAIRKEFEEINKRLRK